MELNHTYYFVHKFHAETFNLFSFRTFESKIDHLVLKLSEMEYCYLWVRKGLNIQRNECIKHRTTTARLCGQSFETVGSSSASTQIDLEEKILFTAVLCVTGFTVDREFRSSYSLIHDILLGTEFTGRTNSSDTFKEWAVYEFMPSSDLLWPTEIEKVMCEKQYVFRLLIHYMLDEIFHYWKIEFRSKHVL